MNLRHSKLWPRIVLALVVVAMLEGLSLAVLHLSRPLLDEEIRTTRDIWQEQGGLMRLPLAEAFDARGAAQRPDDWFMSGGHYSPSANRLVAEWLGPRLLERVRLTRLTRTRGRPGANDRGH